MLRLTLLLAVAAVVLAALPAQAHHNNVSAGFCAAGICQFIIPPTPIPLLPPLPLPCENIIGSPGLVPPPPVGGVGLNVCM